MNGEYIENATNITRPRLAQTLRTIAANGFDEFYTGTVATNLVNDINNVCSTGPYFCRRLHNIISTQELRNYLVRERNSFKFLYDGRSGYKVYTAPAPYGGPALRIFLGIVAGEYSTVEWHDTAPLHFAQLDFCVVNHCVCNISEG